MKIEFLNKIKNKYIFDLEGYGDEDESKITETKLVIEDFLLYVEEIEKDKIINYKQYKNKRGIYIIKPKNKGILELICNKLNYQYKSEIAYVGISKNLGFRVKCEMGGGDFTSATFVKKIGKYLGYNVDEKSSPEIKSTIKSFIETFFTVKIEEREEEDLHSLETVLIKEMKASLNKKKNKKSYNN